MKKQFLSVLTIVLCLVLCTTGDAMAATWRVDVYPGGFDPANRTINYGDSIEFHNFTGYSLLTIYQTSGVCAPWIIDVPNYGSTVLTFNCGPGVENYADAVFGFNGTITINPPPTATPTPDPNLPATTPTGILIALVLVSVLISVPVFRK